MVTGFCPFCPAVNGAPSRELYQFTATTPVEDGSSLEAQKTVYSTFATEFSPFYPTLPKEKWVFAKHKVGFQSRSTCRTWQVNRKWWTTWAFNSCLMLNICWWWLALIRISRAANRVSQTPCWKTRNRNVASKIYLGVYILRKKKNNKHNKVKLALHLR